MWKARFVAALAVVCTSVPAFAATPLIDAIKQNDLEKVRSLLDQGADPNEGDAAKNHIPPIAVAAGLGRVDMMEMLYAKKADINRVDDNNQTPLFHSVLYNGQGGQPDSVKWLLDHDADTTVKSKYGLTASLRAVDPNIRKMLDDSEVNKKARAEKAAADKIAAEKAAADKAAADKLAADKAAADKAAADKLAADKAAGGNAQPQPEQNPKQKQAQLTDNSKPAPTPNLTIMLPTEEELRAKVEQMLPTPPSPPAPKAGPFMVKRVGGGLGVSDQGVAVTGTATIGATDGSELTIDMQMGMPILRIRGRAEAIPIKLVPKKKVADNGVTSFELVVIPVDAKALATLGLPDSPNAAHFIVTPSVAAKFGLKGDKFEGSFQAKFAPVGGGVIYDGDATRGAIGSALGLGFKGSWQLDRNNWIEADAGVSTLMTWNRDVSPTLSLDIGAGWVGRIPSGQKLFVKGETTVDYFNVKPVGGPDDQGGTTGNYVGVKAGLVW